MNIFKRISGLFSVMEDEVQSFRLLFLQSLFIGFACSYYYIVSSSFLLSNVKIKDLPTAYIITGSAGFMLIKLYKLLQKKWGITGSLKASLFIFFAVCVVNFFAMKLFSGNKAFAVFLAYFTVLFAAPFVTIFSLGLFAQCARLFNMEQSKRLLALVLSGDIIASIVAYMSIPFLKPLINGKTYVLLIVAAIFILLVYIPLNKLIATHKGKINAAVSSKPVQKIGFSFFARNNFFLLIAVTTLFSVFAIYLIDYAYLISVRYMVEITDHTFEIAEIVSVFFFMVKIGELLFSVLSGKILSNRGVLFSLLLLPAVLLIFSGFAFISGFAFEEKIFLLCFLFLGKLMERAVRKSVTTPSVKVMYQVAEPHERLEIEANIDGLLNQIATIISGILLLAISLSFFHDEAHLTEKEHSAKTFQLLVLFSFICIIAFGLWSFFSLRMYNSYRVKIKDFLSSLKMKRATEPDNEVPEVSTTDKAINHIVETLTHINKQELINLIKIYNPKQSLDSANEKEETIIKKLVHIYYVNNFCFSRLLIIRYLQFCPANHAFSFFKDLWEVSDLTGKMELILTFNERPHGQTDAAYFERLCEDCVKEIIWAEACINDTASLKDEELVKALNEHRSLMIYQLFELLKAIYEPSVIQVIYDIISKKESDLENQLFALELLNTTLQPGLKEMIRHTLEPTDFDNKRQYLGKLFHIYKLTPRERLIDILMKDYNLVDLGLKETALILYNKISDERNVLSAFRTNSVESLKYKADEMFSGSSDPTYLAKSDILNQLKHNFLAAKRYSPYMLNYGTFVSRTGKGGSHAARDRYDEQYIVEMNAANTRVKVDSLALGILVTLKQKRPEISGGAALAATTDVAV